MSSSQFCLRWNNHQPNFVSVFTSLLQNDQLVDVTLVAEDNQIQAHKVVLSACSIYFKTLFLRNPCKHPIIIMADMKYVYLKNLIEFMYRGEVNIYQEHLPELLRIAELLKVKGLEEIPSFDVGSDFENEHETVKSGNKSNEYCDDNDEAVSEFDCSLDIKPSINTEETEVQSGEEGRNCSIDEMEAGENLETEENDQNFERESNGNAEEELLKVLGVREDYKKKKRSRKLITQTSTDPDHNLRKIRKIRISDKNAFSISQSSTSSGRPSKAPFTADTQSKTVLNKLSNATTITLLESIASKPIQNDEEMCVNVNPQNIFNLHNSTEVYGDVKQGIGLKEVDDEFAKRRPIKNSANMHKALEAVRFGGLGFCKAARMYGVNNRTLWLEYKKHGYPATTARYRKKQCNETQNTNDGHE